MPEWSKYDPESVPWSETNSHKTRSVAHELSQHVLPPEGSLVIPAESLVFVTQGDFAFEDIGSAVSGDLAWIRADTLTTTDTGGEFWTLAVTENTGPESSCLIHSNQVAWQEFDDPAGRPTQPVQVLLEGDLSVLRTRFIPGYTAGEHWHDFSTWYFITDGRMRFGHEGWYETGQIRSVKGGYSYGPEEPGDEGVEFVLVSVGGPVNLHWADLEPAPNGPLT